jgi:type I restriction enzyme S subunit
MQQLLTGKRRFPGFLGEWKRVAFGDLVELVSDKVDPRELQKDLQCIELEHIESGTYRLSGTVVASEQKSLKLVFRKDDVLFGKLRAYLKKAVLASFDGVCSSEIWVFRPQQRSVISSYLFLIVQSEPFNRAACVASGSQMPRSEWSSVSQLICNLPSHEEQRKIAGLLNAIDCEITLLTQQLAALKTQKRGLMRKLLTGEVRVKVPS